MRKNPSCRRRKRETAAANEISTEKKISQTLLVFRGGVGCRGGAHSRARLDGARDPMSPAKGLNDIEAQIAALEAKLGGIDSDAEEDESSSRSGDSRSGRGGGVESAGGEKKAKKSKKDK